MLIVRSWLEDYLSCADISDHDLAEILTGLGLEVEGVSTYAALDAQIVVGKIVSIAKHPQADTLQVCSVEVGGADVLSIVCGATNIYEGMYVAVAQVGACLPGGMKMKRAKIRSVESMGMLCSADELALTDVRQAGILDLKKRCDDSALGLACETYLSLKDSVFDVAITPNRGDCLGYIGVARDVAAKLCRPLKRPLKKTSFGSDGQGIVHKTSDYLVVESFDEELSERFAAMYVDGVRGDVDSPYWFQRRLKLSGVRPRCLLVDVTNYVMLEWGQPVHAYNYSVLPDSRFKKAKNLTVKLASPGSTLTTLDGKQRELSAEDMVIVSGETILGLAGVMGGEASEVSAATRCCVIEVAEFSPVHVRRTAKRHKLHSEASHRFERGVDSRVIDEVIYRVAYWLCALHDESGLALPQPASYIEDKDLKSHNDQPTRVALRLEKAQKLLGLSDLKAEECSDILDALECEQLDRRGERLVFAIPSHRKDLVREVDLIEEIARLKGYESIAEILPLQSAVGYREHPFVAFKQQVVKVFATLGLYEVVLYPFGSSEEYSRAMIREDHPLFPHIEIHNPISVDQCFLQTTQVISMIKAYVRNRSYMQKSCRLFQVGRCYYSKDYLERDGQDGWKKELLSCFGLTDPSLHLTAKAASEDRPVEKPFVSLLVGHPWQEKSWQGAEQAVNFFHIKEIVSAFLRCFGSLPVSYRAISKELFPYMNPIQSAAMYLGEQCIGYLGMIHPQVALNEDLGLKELFGVAEIHLERLFRYVNETALIQSDALSHFPSCLRDISFSLKSSISYAQVCAAFDSFPKRKHLSSVELFDVYRGAGIGEEEKSMAYTLSFSSAKRTLQDKEVEKELEHLKDHLKKVLGIQLR